MLMQDTLCTSVQNAQVHTSTGHACLTVQAHVRTSAIHACMDTYAEHMCIQVYEEPEELLSVLFSHFPPYSLEARSLSEPGTSPQDRQLEP